MAEYDYSHLPVAIQEGIKALKDYLGPSHETLLTSIAPSGKQLATFKYALPPDYLNQDRTLFIGFEKTFPNTGLELKLSPSPELDWPHTLHDSICLFGVGQNPPYGDSRAVVNQTMLRLSFLLEKVIQGSDNSVRQKEFETEITTYWQSQLEFAPQQLILLDEPRKTGSMMVLSDHRWRPSGGEQYLWFSTEPEPLQDHLARLTGIKGKIKYPAKAGYYLTLHSLPNVKVPIASKIKEWLIPHLKADEVESFELWLIESSKYPIRWLFLRLPGEGLLIQSLIVRNTGVKTGSNIIHGNRSQKRSLNQCRVNIQGRLQYAPVHTLSYKSIHSRNPLYISRAIGNKKVLMVGMGSLGSKVTMALIKEGVEHIYLLDPDYLSDANVGRHILGADDLGRNKAVALKELINRDMPLVKVEYDKTHLQIKLNQYPNFLDQFDLVVVTTAEPWSETALWARKAQGAKWALVQGWSEPYGIVGHTLTAPAGSSADATPLFDNSGNFLHAYTDFPDHGHIPLPGCGVGYIPGGPLGMTQIAAMVAQAALDNLTAENLEPSWHYWIGDTTAAATYGGEYIGPILSEGMTSGTFKKNWPVAAPLPKHNWKWNWPTLNVELGIDPITYQFLSSQKQANGENERGGQLFMDHHNSDGLTIIAATPSQRRDKAGPTWLELDEERCRKEIIRYNRQGYLLIGYWHTHPEIIPGISSQDIASFRRFSKQNNALLPNPIAIIVGQSPTLQGVRIWSIQNQEPIAAEIVIKQPFAFSTN